MSNNETSAFFTPQELADYLDLPVGTIYQWRVRGEGPAGLKIGRHVRFRRTEVEAWLEDQRTAQAR